MNNSYNYLLYLFYLIFKFDLVWYVMYRDVLCVAKKSHFTHVVISDLGKTYLVTCRVSVLWFQTHVIDIWTLSDMFDLYVRSWEWHQYYVHRHNNCYLVKLLENCRITDCNGWVPYVVLAGTLIESRVRKILWWKIKRQYDSVVCYIYPLALNKK
jgi:hypothetical protein